MKNQIKRIVITTNKYGYLIRSIYDFNGNLITNSDVEAGKPEVIK